LNVARGLQRCTAAFKAVVAEALSAENWFFYFTSYTRMEPKVLREQSSIWDAIRNSFPIFFSIK
jgi:hypothetical protein